MEPPSKQASKGPLSTPPSIATPTGDFNMMATLTSFPKATACGPTGLRIQHLLDTAMCTLCASLRDVVNLLAAVKVSHQVATFMAGANLTALDKNKQGSTRDIQPIAVGEALRRLTSKCLCTITKSKASDFSPHQLGVACPSGAEKIIHGLRRCIEEHWIEEDFVALKIDLRNAFNMVSRQAVLDEYSVHFPELAPWVNWCYGQHPVLFHQMGISSPQR